MAIVSHPTSGVSTPPTVSMTAEGRGFVLTCECLWIRYSHSRNEAADAQREHVKKCKGAPIKVESAPKASPRGRTSWDDREGATWIDQM